MARQGSWDRKVWEDLDGVVDSESGAVVLDEQMTITNAEGGVVQYDWQVGDTATVGTYYVEFEVTYADASVETFPNTGSLPLVITREIN